MDTDPKNNCVQSLENISNLSNKDKLATNDDDLSVNIDSCSNYKQNKSDLLVDNESLDENKLDHLEEKQNEIKETELSIEGNGSNAESKPKHVSFSEGLQISLLPIEDLLPAKNPNAIEVEIKEVSEEASVQKSVQVTDVTIVSSSSAFTKCQDIGSGTEDSESDSEDSSDSDSSDLSSSTKSKHSEKSNSSEEEPEVVKKPSNPRNGPEPQQGLSKQKKGARYKDELDLDDLPPIEELQITVPEEDCEPLGTVCSIVNQLVVVQSLPNKPALNLDSLLFKKYGECLGQIFDVFGPVKTPFYTLRFNSRQDISDKGIELGQTVYCAPQTPHTKYVFVYQLMQQKGSDASWKHNYEVPAALADYSDDEEERKAKRKHHQKTRERPNRKSNDNETPRKKKPVVKADFFNDYNPSSGNEWYRSRVSELNQFNRLNPNHHSQQQCNFSPHQRDNFESCPPGNSSGQKQFLPPPVLRPPTPNNWHIPTPNSQYGPPNNQNPGYCPASPSFCSPNHNVPHPYLPNNSPAGQFSSPPPFVPPPPSFSYEKLNSSPHFTNPIPQNLTRHPPPSPQWHQSSRPNFPFRTDNTGQSNLTPPRPFPPRLSRPNIPFNLRPNFSSQPPPPGVQQESLNGPLPNYLNQPPPNF